MTAMPTISNSATKMIKKIPNGSLYQAGSVLRFVAFVVNPGVDDGKGDFVRPFSPGVERKMLCSRSFPDTIVLSLEKYQLALKL